MVTALEFALFDIPTAYAGMMVWDVARAPEVLRRWTEWAVAAPEQATTALRILHLPPLPELPAILSGRSVVVIDGAVLAADDRADRILADLRGLGPEVDTFLRTPARSLTRLHMDPEGSGAGLSGSAMLAGLPDAGVDAVSHLDGQFLAFAGGMVFTPAMARQVAADTAAFTSALAPWTGGRTYLNFAEDAVDARAGYDEPTWRRLVGIRSAVDPNGIFAANHPVPRLYEDGRPTC